MNTVRLSRRELLKRAIAGAIIAVPVSAQDGFENLSAAEATTLEAMVARLIPTDENGPGATEARAAHYIDRALADALASSREAYAAGLAALNTYAQRAKGAVFAELEPHDQDALLRDMEDSSAFFDLVRTHTIEGTFCDPHYGGNANFVGWDLIGYPGIRIVVTADQQRLGVSPRPVHRSAYDFERFVKEVIRRGR